jgi:hypothetical protein
MANIDVPVAWVSTDGPTPPEVCARHGEATEEMHKAKFRRKAPGWIWIVAVTSGVLGVFLGVAVTPVIAFVPVVAFFAALQKVWSPTEVVWPYCARCAALHWVHILGRAGAALTVIGVFVAVRRVRTDGITLSTLAGVLLGIIVAFLLVEGFSWQRLAGAHVSRDRSSVRVKAHARFAAAVRDRLGEERVPAAS